MNHARHESSQPKERIGARVRRFLGSIVMGGIMGPRNRREKLEGDRQRAAQQLEAINAVAASLPTDHHRPARLSRGVFSRSEDVFQEPTGEDTGTSSVTLGNEKPVSGSNMDTVEDTPAVRSHAALHQGSRGSHEMPPWGVPSIPSELGGWVPGEREARPGVIDPANPLSPGGAPGFSQDPHHRK